MKLFATLLLVLSFSASADTTDIRTFLYSGTTDSVSLNLSTEKTRTEYRNVRVPATCYRTVTRRVCSPVRQCDRRGNCRTVNRCRPVTQRVPYRCMRTVRQSYQVHDYYVETQAEFDFALPAEMDPIREEISLRMNGEAASLNVNSSRNYFLVLDRQNRTESRRAGVKYVNLTYKVRLVSAEAAKRVLSNGIQNVKLRSGVLSFTLGEGFNLNEFTQQIRIFQNRRLGTDPLLLDKYLSNNEADIQTINNGTEITIDLNSLGINLPSKMRVILDTAYNIDVNKVLNRDEIKTDASANWIFR